MDGYAIACIVVTILIFILLFRNWFMESFSDKAEKAQAIYGWMKEGPDQMTYDNYHRAIEGDVVEYTDVMRLKNNGKFTVENIEKII